MNRYQQDKAMLDLATRQVELTRHAKQCLDDGLPLGKVLKGLGIGGGTWRTRVADFREYDRARAEAIAAKLPGTGPKSGGIGSSTGPTTTRTMDTPPA